MTSTWTLLNASAVPNRDDGLGFYHKGAYYLSNGFIFGGGARRDLYKTTDKGVSWSAVNTSTPYAAYSPICSDGTNIYTVDNNGVKISTDDGVTFSNMSHTGTLPHNSPINNSYALACPMFWFKDKLHVVSGAKIFVGTISGSTVSWVNYNTPWGALGKNNVGYSAVISRNRIVILCGAYNVTNPAGAEGGYNYTSLSSVYSIGDPSNSSDWILHTSDLGCDPRMWAGATVKGGYIWLSGGYDNVRGSPYNFNDTFRAKETDLSSWALFPVTSAYSQRHAPTLYNMGGDIVIACGNDNTSNPSTLPSVYKLTIDEDDMSNKEPVYTDPATGKLYYDDGGVWEEIPCCGEGGGDPDPDPDPDPEPSEYAFSFKESRMNTTSQTSYTFTSVDFGAADANREILVMAFTSSGGIQAPTGCTIGGVSATKLVESNNTSSGASFFMTAYIASVPTGTTGSVVVNRSGAGTVCGIAVYRIVGRDTGTAIATTKDETVSSSALSSSITIPAGGSAVAACCQWTNNGSGCSITWTGPTEDMDTQSATSTCMSAASKSSVAGESLSITATAPATANYGSMVAVAFGPA